MAFTVTTAASREILAAAERSEAAGLALRVAARQIADGSLEYGMGFDEQREDDVPVEFDGLTVLLGSPSRPLLAATVLDYVELAPGRFDFVFVPTAAGPVPSGCSAEAGFQARGACGTGNGSSGCGSCGA